MRAPAGALLDDRRGSAPRARRPAGGRTRRPPRGRRAARGTAARWRRGRRSPGRRSRGRRRSARTAGPAGRGRARRWSGGSTLLDRARRRAGRRGGGGRRSAVSPTRAASTAAVDGPFSRIERAMRSRVRASWLGRARPSRTARAASSVVPANFTTPVCPNSPPGAQTGAGDVHDHVAAAPGDSAHACRARPRSTRVVEVTDLGPRYGEHGGRGRADHDAWRPGR